MSLPQTLLNPELIRAAAESPLGIFALMVVLLGLLAALFFRQAPVQVRVAIFLLIFGGVCVFGYAVVVATPAGGGQFRPAIQTPASTLAPTRTRPPPDATVGRAW